MLYLPSNFSSSRSITWPSSSTVLRPENWVSRQVSCWGLCGVPLWQHLKFVRTSLGRKFDALALNDDDWMADLDDRMVETSILTNLYAIPGLVE